MSSTTPDPGPLYPPGEPFDSGRLQVPGGHQLYYEQCGNPDGRPVLYLHGGPGGTIEPKNRGYFDPQAYRAVLFEQRGCGRSRPRAAVENNTTADLVADIERLREHLGIDRLLLFGGSWGATLALAHAQEHPERVTGLVLRGVFLGTMDEVRWLYGADGVARFFPDDYRDFLAPLDPDERADPVAAYHRRLFSDSDDLRRSSALTWARWEGAVSFLRTAEAEEWCPGDDEIDEIVALSRIETHYFMNACFLKPGQILDRTDRIRHLPATIIQGRYDMVCPPAGAWSLHRAWPGSDLVWVPGAGHSSSDPGVAEALVRATDALRP